MNFDFYNCPSPQAFETNLLPQEQPLFLTYGPDFETMAKLAAKYENFKNILVVGHGGSVSSFYGIYHSLRLLVKKSAYFLSTVDPDYVTELKSKLLSENTLVIAISKSGEDTTQLEALSQFWDYPILVITETNTPLYTIAQNKNLEIVSHPPIGGRFTGITEVALLPALLCGLDAKSVFDGGRGFHESYSKNNAAWQLASVLFQLEQKGIVDVFVPIYSRRLFNFNWLIGQLCHEGFGKDGQGQTYICLEGPEWQHHTLQRFLDGRKNAAGIFIGFIEQKIDTKNNFVDDVADVEIRKSTLGEINSVTLFQGLMCEKSVTIEKSFDLGIPVIDWNLEEDTSGRIGEFIAFWQNFAVYSAILRGVDPFNQPDVEAGKLRAFQKRLDYAKN